MIIFYVISTITLIIFLSNLRGKSRDAQIRTSSGKVTIISCSRTETSWYRNKIGKTYEIINDYLDDEYVVNNPEGEEDTWHRVLKKDCDRKKVIQSGTSYFHQYLKVIEIFSLSLYLANVYKDHMYWYWVLFIVLSIVFLKSGNLNKSIYFPISLVGWSFGVFKIAIHFDWSLYVTIPVFLVAMYFRYIINNAWLIDLSRDRVARNLKRDEDYVRREMKREAERKEAERKEEEKKEEERKRLESLSIQHVYYHSMTPFDNNLEKGQLGEKETAYQLRFIRDEYRIFNGIYLRGGGETQEFDHIVVGANGIFHIDSKHYYGELHFSESQGLTRSNGIITDDPVGQMQRHEYVLRNFLREHQIEAEITGIICFTNPESQIIGEIPYFHAVKVGVLSSKIRSHVSKTTLTQDEINRIAENIKKKSKRSETYDREFVLS